MPLTDTQVKNAKPEARPYRKADGQGMYLLVKPNGTKLWRFDYRIGGTRKTISFGVYPDVKLKEARNRRSEARELVANGVDPSLHRQIQKEATGSNSFESVAREWFTKNKATWTESHGSRILRRLEMDIFPWIGNRPIGEIKAPELLRALRRVENRGAVETAHRIQQNCGQVFRYAVATGRAERDPTGDLKGALPPVKAKHHASIIDPVEIGKLLKAIDGYEGHFITKCALQLAPLVFVRPGELRHAEWSEIDEKAKEWRIPAEKMKMRETHIVPLSEQALAILEELKPLTGRGKYLFPGIRSSARPMSENTVNGALRRLGYTKEEMTGHGFRSIASTHLNEMGFWNRDAIERQLAHAERNNIRAAYNYAEHLPERKKMMQAWSDYLMQLKAGGDVISIHDWKEQHVQ
ncbi:MAG: integrase arm-type DNA-binding domain-containing protein [Candidatus Thiodiazotropha taylori]|nr:integrase arm-type DNA-binding domain-containing protein [Candidatus Thiodiazotropha taylori]